MPIYEYACQKCGHEFDALQKVSDGPLKKCPECGALRLRRLVSAPQFRLKGTGWYETDFKQDNKKRLHDAGDGKPAAEASAGDKAETKAASDKTDTTDKPDKKEKKEKKPPATPAAAD